MPQPHSTPAADSLQPKAFENTKAFENKDVNPSSASSAAKKKILLVDDHYDTGYVLQIMLERRGFEIRRAMDVCGALDVASKEKFDLLISDIGLPDGSGLDIMQTLSTGGPLKAIALSGFGTEQDVQRSLGAGFAVHFTKPFNFPELHRTIEDLLSEVY